MLVQHLVTVQSKSDFALISERCSHFLEEAADDALLKNLSREYSNVHKVKARKRNISTEFTTVFNMAFEDISDDICQRAVFAHGVSSFEPSLNKEVEPFYIFPVDGYQYMYSTEVTNSSSDYKDVFEAVFRQFGFEKGRDIVLEVLQFGYNQTKLREGISNGSEIILYNIPHYYAVRASLYEYSHLLTLIKTHE